MNPMRIKNIISLLCLFIVMSCSNENDIFTPESESLTAMQAIYEQSKELTLVHNEMLDVFL